jgi:hypothetical protein
MTSIFAHALPQAIADGVFGALLATAMGLDVKRGLARHWSHWLAAAMTVASWWLTSAWYIYFGLTSAG